MTNKKISALTSATTPLAGTEVLPIVQSSATVKVSVSDLTAGRNVSMADLTTTGNNILGNAQADTLNVGNGDIIKDNVGYTGFGTSPSYKVHIYETKTVNTLSGDGLLTIQNPSSTTTDVASILFSSNGSRRGQISSGFGGTGIDGFISFTTRSDSTGDFINAGRFDANGYLLVGYTSSNGAYKLQVNSQIFATSSTIATSDGRYKEAVTPLTGALDIVNSLNPVQFTWKQHHVHNFDTSTPTVGFIAQEVQQVLADKPYLNSIIKTNEYVVEPKIKDENGNITKPAVTEEFLGIAEGNLIAILTAAIQEQQTIINQLKTRLDAANL